MCHCSILTVFCVSSCQHPSPMSFNCCCVEGSKLLASGGNLGSSFVRSLIRSALDTEIFRFGPMYGNMLCKPCEENGILNQLHEAALLQKQTVRSASLHQLNILSTSEEILCSMEFVITIYDYITPEHYQFRTTIILTSCANLKAHCMDLLSQRTKLFTPVFISCNNSIKSF